MHKIKYYQLKKIACLYEVYSNQECTFIKIKSSVRNRLGASRIKETHLSIRYRKWQHDGAKKRAIVEVGHTILIIVYNILKENVCYLELGYGFEDEKKRQTRNKVSSTSIIRNRSGFSRYKKSIVTTILWSIFNGIATF